MNEAPPSSPGVVDSLRALADGLLASVQDRVALFSLELEAEKLRLIQTMVWVGAGIVTGVMALAMASFTLGYLYWHSARATVLLVLCCVHGGLFAVAAIGVRRALSRSPRPFAASLEEIAEDRKCLRTDR